MLGRGQTGRLEQELDLGGRGHERIVDLVVEGHHQLADGGQPLRVDQVPFRRGQRFPHRPDPAHPFEDLGEQFGERFVLDEVVIGALPEGAGGNGLAAVGGDQDDRRMPRPGPERRDELESRRVGQLVVQDDDVHRVGGQGLVAGADHRRPGKAAARSGRE